MSLWCTFLRDVCENVIENNPQELGGFDENNEPIEVEITPITVVGEHVKEVESFVYLGSVVDKKGGTDQDVKARVGKARGAFVLLKKIWGSTEISTGTKLRIFNSNVKSVLLYGCETWRTTKALHQKIQCFVNTCLRRILGIRWPDRISNTDLWERAGQEPLAKQILQRK